MCGNGGTEADMGHASPKCAAELKQGAVQPYRERGGAYAGIGRGLGVGPGSVSDWARRAGAAGSDPSASPLQVAEENRGLKGENERLGREDEMLLKAGAFLAGRQL